MKKYIIIGAVIIILLIVTYVIFKKRAKAKADASVTSAATTPKTTVTTKSPTKSATATSSTFGVFPLKMGSKGPEVADLQRYILKEYDANALPLFGADGQWGSEMNSAVKTYLMKDSVSVGWYTGAGISDY